MDFDFSDSEKALRGQVESLFTEESRGSLSLLEMEDLQRVREEVLGWQRKLAPTGYLGMGVDDGKSSPGLVNVQESLAAFSPSLFLSVEITTRIFGPLIALYGHEQIKDDLLPAIKDGGIIACTTVPGDGIMGTPGEGGFSVSGLSRQVANAPIADWNAIGGKVEDGRAMFIRKRGERGFSVGPRLSTLGYKGLVCADIEMQACRVPQEGLMGPSSKGKPWEDLSLWEDQVLVAGALGIMKRSYDTALGYAKEKRVNGKPLIAREEVGFRLAEMLTLLQTGQFLAYRAAWMSQTENREAGILFQCAKAFCGESAEDISSHAIGIMGDDGYLEDNPAEKGYRDAKYTQIKGTSLDESRTRIGDGVLE